MAHFVLDVNETLSDMTPLGTVLSEHGAPAELARTWFASVLRDGFAFSIHGRAPGFLALGRELLTDLLADVDGLDAPPSAVVDDVFGALGSLAVHPDVAPGVTALTDAGHGVSLFTNGAAASASGLVERAGIRDRIGHVLSVEDLSVWKPHPAAYAHAIDRIGTLAGQLTMVAVHPWDLEGAASAGMRTVWIDRGGRAWPSSFRAPDARATSFTALAADA